MSYKESSKSGTNSLFVIQLIKCYYHIHITPPDLGITVNVYIYFEVQIFSYITACFGFAIVGLDARSGVKCLHSSQLCNPLLILKGPAASQLFKRKDAVRREQNDTGKEKQQKGGAWKESSCG